MELSYDNPHSIHVKLLTTPQAPPLRRLEIRVEPASYEQIVDISLLEGVDIAVVGRRFLKFGVEYYRKTQEIAQRDGVEVSALMGDLASLALTFYDQVRLIAQEEEMGITELARDFASYALRNYHYRRGALNEQRNATLPEKHKMFHCQVCRKETNVRWRHRVAVLGEEFVCCEECFFADRHKDLAIVLITNKP